MYTSFLSAKIALERIHAAGSFIVVCVVFFSPGANLLLGGRVSLSIRSVVFGTTLFALRKENGFDGMLAYFLPPCC